MPDTNRATAVAKSLCLPAVPSISKRDYPDLRPPDPAGNRLQYWPVQMPLMSYARSENIKHTFVENLAAAVTR